MVTMQDDFTLRTTDTMMRYTLDDARRKIHISVIVDLSVKDGENCTISIETANETRYRMKRVRTDDAFIFDIFLSEVKKEADALSGVDVDY